MSKEDVRFGEGFTVKTISGAPATREVRVRHYVIGWSAIAAIISSVVYFIFGR